MAKLQRKKLAPDKIPPVVVAKWATGVLDEGFTPLPKRMLRCLSALFTGSDPLGELQVVLAIADYQRPDLARGPSLEFLAFTAGLEPARYQEILAELKQRGLVEVEGPEQALSIKMDGLFDLILKKTAEGGSQD